MTIHPKELEAEQTDRLTTDWQFSHKAVLKPLKKEVSNGPPQSDEDLDEYLAWLKKGEAPIVPVEPWTFRRARPVDIRERAVEFSLSFARENEVSDAIVHRQLQKIQLDSPSNYARRGKQYTSGYSGQVIFNDLGCFEHRSIVYDAAARLARNRHLEPEAPECLYTDAWYKYPLSQYFHVAAPLSDDDLISINAFEAKNYGLVKAVLLSAYRAKPVEKVERGVKYKRVSAKELALELPYSPQTIGKHLRQLVGDEILSVHPKSPKYYQCTIV